MALIAIELNQEPEPTKQKSLTDPSNRLTSQEYNTTKPTTIGNPPKGLEDHKRNIQVNTGVFPGKYRLSKSTVACGPRSLRLGDSEEIGNIEEFTGHSSGNYEWEVAKQVHYNSTKWYTGPI